MAEGTGFEDPPEPNRVAGIPVVLCPHLPRNQFWVFDKGTAPVCELCVADALREAEGLLDG